MLGPPLLGGPSTTWWAFYCMLGLLLHVGPSTADRVQLMQEGRGRHPSSFPRPCLRSDWWSSSTSPSYPPDVRFPNAPDQTHNHHIAVQFRPNQHYHQHHDLDLNTSQRNWCMNGLAPSSAKKDAVYFVQNIKINHYFGWKSGFPRNLCSWSMNNKAWTNQYFRI